MLNEYYLIPSVPRPGGNLRLRKMVLVVSVGTLSVNYYNCSINILHSLYLSYIGDFLFRSRRKMLFICYYNSKLQRHNKLLLIIPT